MSERKLRTAGWVLAIALSALGALALVRAIAANPYWQTTTDFGVFLLAADVIRHGGDPYAAPLLGTKDYYVYPPVLAEGLSVAVAVIPADWARTIWIGTSIGALYGGMYLFAVLVGAVPARMWAALGGGAALFSYTGRNDLYHGQTNLVLFGMLAAAAYLLSRRRDTLAGICLGLILAVKPFLAVVGLYLLLRRRFRAAASAALTSLTGIAASFVLLRDSGGVFLDWLAVLRTYAADLVARPGNHSLVGLFVRLTSRNDYYQPWVDLPVVAAVAPIAIGTALALGLVYVFLRTPDVRESSVRLVELSFVLTLALIYGPITGAGYLFLIFPGAAASYALLRTVTISTARRALVLTVALWTLLLVQFVIPTQSIFGIGGSLPLGTSGPSLPWSGRVSLLLLAIAVSTGIALLVRDRSKAEITSYGQKTAGIQEAQAARAG
jgi:hypothetical protein